MKKFLNFTFIFFLLNFNFSYAEDKQRPWIGIEFTDVTEEFIKLNNLDIKTPKNIIVTGVVETSAADEANIVPGDVIISINNKITKVKQDLIEILKTKYASDIVNLKIYRQGNTLTKNVILKKFPDPGFKPSWSKGSKLLKNPKKKNYGFENIVLTSKDTILYPKYFSKEVVSKYNNENLIVVCVQKGLKNNLQLYDQIISIDERDPRNEYYNLTNKSVKVKFKRGNKTFTKLITPTLNNRSLSIRHDCTPEFAMYDCLIDYDTPWKLDKNKKKEIGDAWRKALKCMKNISPVPFSNAFFNKKQPDQSVKLDTITWMLGYLQYDAQDLKSKKNLEEINAILVLAKNQLKEFEKFQKIYPNHLMEQSYNDLLNAITRATSWAAGSYSDNLKSTKNTTIKTDKNTTKAIKAAYEKIIKENKINSQKAVKFLTSKSRYLEKDNELDYLIQNYETTKKNINWKQDNLDKYFDNIYDNLSRYYLLRNNYEKALSILDEGLDIVEDNYENLYFKNAFTNLTMGKTFIYISYKAEYLVKFGDELKASAEFHFNDIEKLSESNKDRMLEIGDDYYTDLNYVLYLLNLIAEGYGDKENLTFYPLKSIKFIEKNKKYNLNYELAGALSILLQAAALEDDIKNFNYASNELSIFMSESVNNPSRLDAILSSATMLLSVYETKGYYKKSDEFIKFIEDIFTINDRMKNNSITNNAFILYDYYNGISALRNNDIKKAQAIFEKRLLKARINIKNIDLNMTVIDSVVITKFVPELYEIYFNEKSFEKLERINRIFLGGTDISDISKKDLKYIDELDLNSYKIFKVLLKYCIYKKDNKKFKIIKNHFLKISDKAIKKLKKNDSQVFINDITNRELVLKELAEISEILIKNSYKKEGKEILDKIYPIILNDYDEKSSANIWKPNIEDNIFGLIYLDIAENYFQSDKSFLQKAYNIARNGKNIFTSRDLKKIIKNKKFKDEDGLISKYEKIQRELTVNSRSSQYSPKEIANNVVISNELNNKNRELQKNLDDLKKDINKKIPEYFKLITTQNIKISEIQSLLENDEVLLDYYFYENDLKVVSITKDTFQILSSRASVKQLNKLNEEIRNTLIPFDGKIKPYAVNKSFELNEKTFLFLNKITKDYKNIIVIPDGPLNSIPLHAFAYAKNKDCLDCRNVQFNLDNHNFNYYPSVETFKNIDKIDEEFKKISLDIDNKIVKKTIEGSIDVIKQPTLVKQLKQLKSKVLKKDKSKTTKSKSNLSTDNFYLGIGDPDLYSKAKAKKVDSAKKITMLRSLFNKDTISSQSIKEIYGPVDGSAEEINQVAEYLSPLKSKILLRENAKEINLKELDLSSYKIIHFATHGEISGAITGINEPFLVLSPPNGPSTEDGLLTMSEIMSLNTNANLVVLSACNTAAGDETGSEGFSGLAKSFFMSGSKSILVSNWYVETYSAKEIVINLFKNLKDNPNFSISDGLNLTMSEMAKNEKELSHPLFWAPFVVVGKNQSLFF